MDVYQAFASLNADRETDPVPIDEESAVRAERYPYRGQRPGMDDYDKLDVEDVYLPGYGHLAAALPECWAEHDLCLYSLDALSEFWMVVYLSPRRSAATLAGQTEWQTRILPLYVAQMVAEARGCEHSAWHWRAER